MRVKEAAVIFKRNNVSARSLAREITAWLGSREIKCRLAEAGDNSALDPAPDLAIILGGDGTILGAARKLAGSGTPILGINFGRVGFLAALSPGEWQKGVELALAGGLEICPCLALLWKVGRDGEEIATGPAINDVVVARGSLARLTNLSIKIDGETLGALRSDGIIISAPLGSPGYSASAGGPILSPRAAAAVLAPICSFVPDVSPLVLGADSIFEISVLDDSGDCYLTIDGQEGMPLFKKDVVSVRCRPGAIHFLVKKTGFFEKLKIRGFSLPQASL